MSELNEFSRAELLLGKEGIEKLRKARVAVFGIGGVGSFAAEALARGGVGHLDLVDGDVVSLTNINRQLIATQKTIGRRKTSVMAERIHEILPGDRGGGISCGLRCGKQGFAGFCFV